MPTNPDPTAPIRFVSQKGKHASGRATRSKLIELREVINELLELLADSEDAEDADEDSAKPKE